MRLLCNILCVRQLVWSGRWPRSLYVLLLFCSALCSWWHSFLLQGHRSASHPCPVFPTTFHYSRYCTGDEAEAECCPQSPCPMALGPGRAAEGILVLAGFSPDRFPGGCHVRKAKPRLLLGLRNLRCVRCIRSSSPYPEGHLEGLAENATCQVVREMSLVAACCRGEGVFRPLVCIMPWASLL